MCKYIIREVVDPDFEFYFDGDMFSSSAGGYCYNLFVVHREYYRTYSNLNSDDFQAAWKEKDDLLNDVYDVLSGYGYYKTIKEVLKDYNIKFNTNVAHKLKILAEKEDFYSFDTFCTYLEIKTGEKWTHKAINGYCQGDYAEIIYCTKYYSEDSINIIGDLYFGCGKEFCVMVDKDEDSTVYGYYVADCQGFKPDDYKRIVSADYGIGENDEVVLELIEGYTTVKKVNYATY